MSAGLSGVLADRVFAVLSLIFALNALPAGSFAQDWLNDPQAVTMFAIAIVGGGFALYRFRFIPRERRRETLKAMQDAYGESATERGALLRSFPPFLLMGKEAVSAAVASTAPAHSDLEAEFRSWDGLTSTAAHEIRDSEAKFRSLLWVAYELAPLLEDLDLAPVDDEILVEEIKVGRVLVNKLNNFAQMVELNLFPQDDVLGQLHRSIAPACKAVEPLVWSQNALGARWGLRVLRLLRRAEGFNDMRSIHRANRLAWRRQDGSEILIQSALYRSDFGRSVPTSRLQSMSGCDRVLLQAGIALTRIHPRYGGARLRRHIAAENDLVGRLKFAFEAGWHPLDLDGWNKTKLDRYLERHWEAKLEPAETG
jgi:hypothetical protein